MNDIINTASTSQEGENKELGMKLYPKEYINMTLNPGGPAVEISIDDFIFICGASNWTHDGNSDYLDTTKIPEGFSTIKKKIETIDTSTAIQYSKIRNILRSMPVILIDTGVSDLHIQAAGELIVLKRIISGDYKKEIKKENTFNNLNIQVDQTGNILRMKSGTKSAVLPGMGFHILNQEKNVIMIHDENQINIIQVDKELGYKILQTEDLSIFGKLKYMTMDNNNNFVACIFEIEDSNNPEQKTQQLRVFQMDHNVDLNDPESPSCLMEQDMIPDIQEILYVDDNDDLILLDTDYRVRRLQTNMQEFPVGYEGRAKFTREGVKVRKTVNKTLEDATALLAKGIKINTETLETEEEDVDMAKLRHQIWNMSFDEFDNKTLKELFDASETVEDLLKVKSIIDAIKRTPEIAAVHGLLDPIESTVFKKYNQAKLDELYVRLDNLASSLGTGEDFNNLIYIQSSLREIQKDRAQISNVAPTAKDKEIKELSQLVDQKISEYRESHQEDIQEKIDINLNTIKEYLENIDFMSQITSVYNLEVWKTTENMITYLDEEGKKKNKETMKGMVKTRQNQLGKSLIDVQKKNQAKEQLKVDEIKDQIGQIKQIISMIYEEDAIKDMEKNDPLVLAIKSAIEDVSSNKSQELVVQLESIFKERLLTVKYSKEVTKKGVKSLDKYGIPNSLYFVPEIHKKVTRELKGKRVNDKIKIYFETNTGTKIEPDINKKILGNFPFQVTEEEFIVIKKRLGERRSNGKRKEFKGLTAQSNTLKKELGDNVEINEEYKQIIEKIKEIDEQYYIPRMLEVMTTISGGLRDLDARPRVPHLSSKTVVGPSIKKFLEKMGTLLDQQMTYKEGFIIVESEAGTGKNFKMDILANLTNRELFHISCNQSMEKEDLLFSPELNNEGSFKQKSELIRGLQTPGAIILLDEINTLRPGIAKLLNPLLAGQRYINDPQLGKIPAHPSVLIVGLMNPRYYLGTSDIAQEFLDRARIMSDDYPEALEEGFIVSKYVDGPVSQMTYEEFENFWNKYVVQGEVPNDKKIYNMFIAISNVMKVARKIRELYSKTMKGEADMDKELKFIFSIRAGNFIMQDFNNSKDIKKSIEDVLMPKIADSTQKKMVQAIIDDVCK